MNIDIEYNEKSLDNLKEISEKLNISDICKYIEEVLFSVIKKGYEIEGIDDSVAISVLITDNENIMKINNEYRGINRVTDVLSFPSYDDLDTAPIYEKQNFPVLLGDIVINVSRIYEQSLEYETGFKRELSYMFVHSFYHLLGYDHEKIEDKKEMRIKEEELLKII